MGLEIHRLSKGDNMSTNRAVLAEVRVYRTVDGEFVGEGDPRGAFLAYPIGHEIPAGDVERYKRFMQGGSESQASRAHTDDDARDELRRRQAGDPSARTPLNETPVLVHDRLATELADEARVRASLPPEVIAAERNASDDDDGVYAEHAVWRTTEGDLVHEGDENGVTLAYPVGARIADADVDEYNDLGAPPSADPPQDETKAAKTPANKARTRTADK